ncbi:hypothetical protein UFOVP621_63 [uncultured Caudovirales phage]|uniref:Uncharacterized protein n=1 Tax=uncultured Caudovirales phage TaxID=2100421 RepID=A0A6J5N2G7_9CAUD|nr:hypothetical protein UFOVP621_63 [uncultured Caudovirales phage]
MAKDNFEEVAPTSSRSIPSRSISERADIAQSSMDPSLRELSLSPEGQQRFNQLAAESAQVNEAHENLRKMRGAVDLPATDRAYIPGNQDPKNWVGAEPKMAKNAEGEYEEVTKKVNLRPNLTADSQEALDAINAEHGATHEKARTARIKKHVASGMLQLLKAHEDLHNAGHVCTNAECREARSSAAAGKLNKDGTPTKNSSRAYTLGDFMDTHMEARQAHDQLQQQAANQEQNQPYVPISQEEFEKSPGLLHQGRLHSVAKWLGSTPKAVRSAFSSSAPTQIRATMERLKSSVAKHAESTLINPERYKAAQEVQEMLPESGINPEAVRAQALDTKFKAPTPIGDQTWMHAIDDNTTVQNVKSLYDVLRTEHATAKARTERVGSTLLGKGSMALKKGKILGRDADLARRMIAQRELEDPTTGVVARASDVQENDPSFIKEKNEQGRATERGGVSFEEAKALIDKDAAIKKAQETRRRNGLTGVVPVVHGIDSPAVDPRPTAADLRAEQQVKISRHVPAVLNDIMDMHSATAMSDSLLPHEIAEYQATASEAGVPEHIQARFVGRTSAAAPDIEGIRSALMNDDNKVTSGVRSSRSEFDEPRPRVSEEDQDARALEREQGSGAPRPTVRENGSTEAQAAATATESASRIGGAQFRGPTNKPAE